METLHSFVKASRMPPPGGGARMTDMLVVGQMMEYFERHPDKNAVATGELTLARIRRIIERFGYEDARTLLSLLRRLTLIYESETQADK